MDYNLIEWIITFIGFGTLLWIIDKITFQVNKYQNYKNLIELFKEDISLQIKLNSNKVEQLKELDISPTNYVIEIKNISRYEINKEKYIKLQILFKSKDFWNIFFNMENSINLHSEIMRAIETKELTKEELKVITTKLSVGIEANSDRLKKNMKILDKNISILDTLFIQDI